MQKTYWQENHTNKEAITISLTFFPSSCYITNLVIRKEKCWRIIYRMHLQFFFATFPLQKKKTNKGWVIVSTSGLIGVRFLHYRPGVGLHWRWFNLCCRAIGRCLICQNLDLDEDWGGFSSPHHRIWVFREIEQKEKNYYQPPPGFENITTALRWVSSFLTRGWNLFCKGIVISMHLYLQKLFLKQSYQMTFLN